MTRNKQESVQMVLAGYAMEDLRRGGQASASTLTRSDKHARARREHRRNRGARARSDFLSSCVVYMYMYGAITIQWQIATWTERGRDSQSRRAATTSS